MNDKKWIYQLGYLLATLIILSPGYVLAQNAASHKIDVTMKDNKVWIVENEQVIAVRSQDKLQWKVVPGSQLKSIDIAFVSQPPNCISTAKGMPCKNKENNGAGVVTCNMKDDLGPNPDPDSEDPDFHDYCYVIYGYTSDGAEIQALDPIVRGRR
jgi:hypothetical protein